MHLQNFRPTYAPKTDAVLFCFVCLRTRSHVFQHVWAAAGSSQVWSHDEVMWNLSPHLWGELLINVFVATSARCFHVQFVWNSTKRDFFCSLLREWIYVFTVSKLNVCFCWSHSGLVSVCWWGCRRNILIIKTPPTCLNLLNLRGSSETNTNIQRRLLVPGTLWWKTASDPEASIHSVRWQLSVSASVRRRRLPVYLSVFISFIVILKETPSFAVCPDFSD